MIIAIDTGGTKTLVALFDDTGEIQESHKFPTPATEEEYVTTVQDYVRQHYGRMPIKAIVIALPGTIKNGVALWCNNLGWAMFDAATAFRDLLDDTPVFIENDANLAGVGEAHMLSPIPLSLLYVTVSTGIGTGIIENGIIDPVTRYSEGGRMLIEYDGALREWESFASGKAIFNKYGMYARDIKSIDTWREITDRIVRGFLILIPVIQPDVIVIGGSMGTHLDKYKSLLSNTLETSLPSHIPLPTLLQAKYPEEAVVYGAYYYALDTLAG